MRIKDKTIYTTIILSISVGFFIISSVIAINLSITASSLRFISDDIAQVLDSTPTQKTDEQLFFQSEKIIVFNLNKSNLDEAARIIEQGNLLKDATSVQLTFSTHRTKANFFRMAQGFTASEMNQENLKKLLITQSKSIVSKGKLCYFEHCIDNYIALRKKSFQTDRIREI